MFSIWQRGLDTMAWLDWRAEVYDRALASKGNLPNAKKLVLKQHLKDFGGYAVTHIDAQIAIYS